MLKYASAFILFKTQVDLLIDTRKKILGHRSRFSRTSAKRVLKMQPDERNDP